MRTFIAFLVAPLGSVMVLAAVLLSSVIRNRSWSGFLEAFLGFSGITYFVYFIGLIFILPIYLLLKSRGKANLRNLLLLSATFGAMVTLPFSVESPAWLAVGIAMGASAGFVLHCVLVRQPPRLAKQIDT
jgi:hypothetical protein